MCNSRFFNFKVEEYEKSIVLAQKSINDGYVVLGADHPLVGQLCVDIAGILMKMNHREEAIVFLQKAYQIYQTKGQSSALEKADMAYQIALLSKEFGAHKDAIFFAQSSNQFFSQDRRFVSKQMANLKVIAESTLIEGNFESASDQADGLFTAARSNITGDNIEPMKEFIVASVRIAFQAQAVPLDKMKKAKLYYIFDMIHASFYLEAIDDSNNTVEELRRICQANKGPSGLLRNIFGDIWSKSNIYHVDNLVNISYDDFLKFNEAGSNSTTQRTMNTMLLIYKTTGYKFLLTIVQPYL